MKSIYLIFTFAIAAFLSGCSATRSVSDVVLSAGGAAIGGQLSHGKPGAIAGGAATGVLLSEGLHYAAGKEASKQYQNGYDKGRSDAVKQQYWLYVDQQHTSRGPDNVRLYEVHL